MRVCGFMCVREDGGVATEIKTDDQMGRRMEGESYFFYMINAQRENNVNN